MKNPANDALTGKYNRSIRTGQINIILGNATSLTFVHPTTKKYKGIELQRNNTLSNREHENNDNPIGLTGLLKKTGHTPIYINMRWFNDPDLYYKVPSGMKNPEKVIEALYDYYWLLVNPIESSNQFIYYRLISTKEILAIPNIQYGFSASKGNESRFSFYMREKKNLNITPYLVEGGTDLFARTPSFLEAVENLFK